MFNLQCNNCLFECKNKYNGECPYCEHKVDEIELQDINYQIKRLNVDLYKFCKRNNLKYKILKEMLKGRREWNYKYLYKINNRLNEDDWIIEHLNKYPNGIRPEAV